MKYFVIAFIFILSIFSSFGQPSMDNISQSENFVLIYVTSKKKIILNGEKSNFQKLEKHIQLTNKTKAKIGTVKPTPLEVFQVFERVVQLMDKYKIESEWFIDPVFSTPFFENHEKKNVSH